MTQKKAKKEAPVREGLAYLIEDVLERSEVVIAAGEIVDQLQAIAEDLGKIQVDDIMPLMDKITTTFGQNVASQFNQVANDQISQLVTAVQGAKAALDNEIVRLKKGIEGGDVSDMGMDTVPPPGPPGGAAPPGGEVPGAGPPGLAGAPKGPGMPEMPPDMGGAPPEAEPSIGGFAGRARKESAKVRGKKLNELMDPAARETHPYKGNYFNGNLDNLALFHGGLGRMARNIEREIDSGKLNGAEREGLANTLSHMASVGHDAGHWVDPETKLEAALKVNKITNRDDPTVAGIIAELRKLAHGLTLRHSNIMENSIIALRKSRNPDALVFKTFRTKLSESRDGQMAAIRTARQFAIDIEDVVTVVREATASGTKLVKEWEKQGKKTRKRVQEDTRPQTTQQIPPENITAPAGKLDPSQSLFPVDHDGSGGGQPEVTANTPNASSAIERDRLHNPDMGQPDWMRGKSQSTRTPLTPADKRLAVAQGNPPQPQPQPQPQNANAVSKSTNTPQQQAPSLQAMQPPKQNKDEPMGFNTISTKPPAGSGRSPMPNVR